MPGWDARKAIAAATLGSLCWLGAPAFGDAEPESGATAPASASPAPDGTGSSGEPLAPRDVGTAYRAIFERFPDDLEVLRHVPSGRGLDSRNLFEDHPILAVASEALMRVAAQPRCEFAADDDGERGMGATDLENMKRAMSLLQHRAVSELTSESALEADHPLEDRLASAMPYAIASLDVADHIGQQDTLGAKRAAGNGAAMMLGLARRLEPGLPLAADAIRGSRYAKSIEDLFGTRSATIGELRRLASRLEGSDASADRAQADAARAAAEALEQAWNDDAEPFAAVRRVMMDVPADAPRVRATLGGLLRFVSEMVAVRQDVRNVLRAFPAARASDTGTDGAQQSGDDSGDDGAPSPWPKP